MSGNVVAQSTAADGFKGTFVTIKTPTVSLLPLYVRFYEKQQKKKNPQCVYISVN